MYTGSHKVFDLRLAFRSKNLPALPPLRNSLQKIKNKNVMGDSDKLSSTVGSARRPQMFINYPQPLKG